MTEVKTKEHIYNLFLRYGAIFFLLLLAATQFILILRHKSPYLSDSYFYKHTFYQIKGYDFQQAYTKIRSQVDLDNSDEITRNIFNNIDSYRNSQAYFAKRTLYPFLAYLIDLVVQKEYIAFILPPFISYLAIIFLVFYFAKITMGYFFATLTSALLIAYYPFLDWSTYFLTDTIGTFFWFIQLFFANKFLTKNNNSWLFFYSLSLAVSFFNREQSFLMIPLFLTLYILITIYKMSDEFKNRCLKLLLFSIVISAVYLLISKPAPGGSALNNISYIRNSSGLYSQKYTFGENLSYLITSAKTSHAVLFLDIIRHHWWFVFVVLAQIGIVKTLVFSKKKEHIDLLIFASGLASYLFIIWPVLSYRFLFPLTITIIYFNAKLIKEYFQMVPTKRFKIS